MKKANQLIAAIFDLNNPFMQGCNVVFDLALLNLLFMITCLPLVTIGAAKISLYRTLWQKLEGDQTNLLILYIKHLKKEWFQGMLLGLVELSILVVIIFDLTILHYQIGFIVPFLKIICYAFLLLTVMTSIGCPL